jgi:6-phosphogluconolactonase
LAANDQPWLSLHPGAGPRHLAFDPAGRYLYVANEIDSTASALAYDGQNGHVRHLQTLSTLPPGFAGANNNTCADIHLSPSGRWLYVSNRGHDSIAVFAIDPATGLLSSAGHTSTQGHTPRNFALVAGSNLLLAANQRSDSIVAFHIDDETGQLSPTGAVSPAPTPVCVCVM